MQFAATPDRPALPAEQSFFLMLADQVVGVELVIENGVLRIPDTTDIDRLVDWEKVASLAG